MKEKGWHGSEEKDDDDTHLSRLKHCHSSFSGLLRQCSPFLILHDQVTKKERVSRSCRIHWVPIHHHLTRFSTWDLSAIITRDLLLLSPSLPNFAIFVGTQKPRSSGNSLRNGKNSHQKKWKLLEEERKWGRKKCVWSCFTLSWHLEHVSFRSETSQSPLFLAFPLFHFLSPFLSLSLSFHNSWIHFPFDERDIRFNSCKKEESQKERESEIVKGG